MRFNETLIYDYVYVVMFDYVVQVGELLEFFNVWTYIINVIMALINVILFFHCGL